MAFAEPTHVLSRSTKVQCYISKYVFDFKLEGYDGLT